MASKKTETLKKQSGFTIVELLIVIVVIGILAAITIVAYAGITARANTTRAQTNGANIVKVVEASNADSTTSGYPASAAALVTYSGTASAIAKIPAGVSVVAGAAGAVTDTNGKTTVQYLPKGTTGGCVGYWDFSTSTLKFFYAGDAATGTATTCA